MEPLELVLLLVAAAGGLLGGWMWGGRGRRRAQAERERVELRASLLEEAFSFVQEGMVLLDGRDRVLRANPAALGILRAGAAPDPEVPVPLSRFARSVAMLAAVEQVDPESTVRRVVEVDGEDGEPHAIELTIAPARGGRRILLLRDLRAIASLDRKRRDFVANASHELQTPIAAILGMLDLLDSVEDSQRQRLLERARHNAASLASLTRDLLGLARAEDPDWQPSPAALRVAEVVEDALVDRRERAGHKGLGFDVRIEPPDLELLADPLAFQTVVGNLVDNAVSYTDSGRVELECGTGPGLGAWLEVRDTGPGIDSETLPRIFERFFRGDPARSRASGGTGLGLSIVRNLVRRMGGRISVSSRPAEGSVFRAELPANPARPLPGAGQTELREPAR